MLPNAPETIGELIPYLVVTAVVGAGALWRAARGAMARLGSWVLERLNRDAEDLKRLRVQNDELIAGKARLAEQNSQLRAKTTELVARTRALSMMTRDGQDAHPDPRVEEARTHAVSAASRAEVAAEASTPEGT